MSEQVWSAVDNYLEELLIPTDPALEATLQASRVAGLPPFNVSPLQGKLLHLLAKMHGARRILEIGTMGGYSTIWLARALPEDGRLVTLEINEEYAQVARANIAAAGLADRVEIRVGPALETLPLLEGPFDLTFIDADKPNNPAYLEWTLRLSRPGSVIIGDNVIRDGEVINADSDDPRVVGVRRFLDLLAAEPRVSATAIQTVGGKGYDGFALGVVTG